MHVFANLICQLLGEYNVKYYSLLHYVIMINFILLVLGFVDMCVRHIPSPLDASESKVHL